MSDIIQNNDPYTQPSFSLGNRARRLVWNVAYLLLFRWTPRPMQGWRRAVLRLFGATMAPGSNIRSSARIWAPWNLEMGELSAVSDDVNIYSMAKIRIGRKATVSQGSHLCAGTHDYESRNFQLYSKPIDIGDEAWVCADAFVGPGVNIGEGAVIGACAVVSKDMPAWTVCAGNPCKPLKPRVIRD